MYGATTRVQIYLAAQIWIRTGLAWPGYSLHGWGAAGFIRRLCFSFSTALFSDRHAIGLLGIFNPYSSAAGRQCTYRCVEGIFRYGARRDLR